MIHRTRKMTFRLTEDEYKIIKAKVNESGTSLQQFLLKTAVEKEIIHIKEYQELIFQIKKIGVNINQITKHFNEIGTISDKDISEIKGGLDNICQLLKQSIHTQI